MISMMLFQSAPRCGHRGDLTIPTTRHIHNSFNPRPGADTGATAVGPSGSAAGRY